MPFPEERSSAAGGLGNRRSIQLSYGAERKNPDEPAQICPPQSQGEPNRDATLSSAQNNERGGGKPQDGAVGNPNALSGGPAHGRSPVRLRSALPPRTISATPSGGFRFIGRKSDTLLGRLWSRIEKRGPSECWPWLGMRDRDGYGRMDFAKKRYQTHRLVLEEKLGRRLAAGEVGRHTCHNPRCNNPKHIIPGTQADNIGDRDRAERQAKGEDNGRAKLTAEDVAIARTLYAKGHPFPKLAAFFGVEVSTVRNAVTGKTWQTAPAEFAPAPAQSSEVAHG